MAYDAWRASCGGDGDMNRELIGPVLIVGGWACLVLAWMLWPRKSDVPKDEA